MAQGLPSEACGGASICPGSDDQLLVSKRISPGRWQARPSSGWSRFVQLEEKDEVIQLYDISDRVSDLAFSMAVHGHFPIALIGFCE